MCAAGCGLGLRNILAADRQSGGGGEAGPENERASLVRSHGARVWRRTGSSSLCIAQAQCRRSHQLLLSIHGSPMRIQIVRGGSWPVRTRMPFRSALAGDRRTWCTCCIDSEPLLLKWCVVSRRSRLCFLWCSSPPRANAAPRPRPPGPPAHHGPARGPHATASMVKKKQKTVECRGQFHFLAL
jgi:hypothetical protein